MARPEDGAVYRACFNEALPLLHYVKNRQDEEGALVIKLVNPPDREAAAAASGVEVARLPLTLQNLADDGPIEADVDYAGMRGSKLYTALNVRRLPAGLRETQLLASTRDRSRCLP